MGDNFLKHLQGRKGRYKGLEKIVKKNIQKIIIILMLAMGVFFCAIFKNYAYAENFSSERSQRTSFKAEYAESINEFQNLDLNLKSEKNNNHCQASQEDLIQKKENQPEEKKEPARIEVYPIEYIVNENMGAISKLAKNNTASLNKDPKSYCDSNGHKQEKKKTNRQEEKISELVSGYPMEEMVPYLSKRESRVAHYLVAIAKKESDWGKHSPRKNGGTCYNYWGYRGTYNQTDSGYSCFDSAEQAVKQVGDKIESLLNKMIDTPEEMVIWKCGSTCAGHDPQGVLKWISDVKLYYVKLNT